jgi:hypothetical protein
MVWILASRAALAESSPHQRKPLPALSFHGNEVNRFQAFLIHMRNLLAAYEISSVL